MSSVGLSVTTGLASQMLTEAFSATFLTPLEETDICFRLEVRSLPLAAAAVSHFYGRFYKLYTTAGGMNVSAFNGVNQDWAFFLSYQLLFFTLQLIFRLTH